MYGLEQIKDKLRTSSMSYLYDIAEGNVPNHTALIKLGYNPDVPATDEDIWDGSSVYTYLSGATTVKIHSTAAADGVAGTGALTVTVYGLDSNWVLQNQTFTLNGSTAVSSTSSFIRIFEALIQTAGSSGANAGTVYIKNSGSGTTLAQIAVGNNCTLMSLWTVPVNNTFYFTDMDASTGLAKATEVKLFIRPNADSTGVFQLRHHGFITQGHIDHSFKMPMKITEKSDIVIRANAAAGGGAVSAGFDGWYEI